MHRCDNQNIVDEDNIIQEISFGEDIITFIKLI